jgi:hypothetical protein
VGRLFKDACVRLAPAKVRTGYDRIEITSDAILDQFTLDQPAADDVRDNSQAEPFLVQRIQNDWRLRAQAARLIMGFVEKRDILGGSH